MVAFNLIPSTLRVPSVMAEFDASQAQQGAAVLAYDCLILGQKLSTGTWAADTFQRANSIADAIAGGGRGSMIHRQAIAWFAINPGVSLWFGVLADNGAGVAATGTIVFTAAATGGGTIAFYLGGVLVQ